MNQLSHGVGGHVNEVEMAAYADRRLPAADRERIESHLAACSECRHELLAIRQIMGRAARPRRLLAGAGLLAVAATLVLLVRPAAPDQVRNGGGERAITAYGPVGESPLASIRFVWGAVPDAASYRLTVSGADGRTLWSGSTADTAVTLPDSVRLEADRRYLWIADALQLDGTSRSTGLREFRPVR